MCMCIRMKDTNIKVLCNFQMLMLKSLWRANNRQFFFSISTFSSYWFLCIFYWDSSINFKQTKEIFLFNKRLWRVVEYIFKVTNDSSTNCLLSVWLKKRLKNDFIGQSSWWEDENFDRKPRRYCSIIETVKFRHFDISYDQFPTLVEHIKAVMTRDLQLPKR